MKRMLPEELKTYLSQFCSTENYFRHSILKNLLFTDGVKFLADEASAYWLIDAIASHQLNPRIRKSSELQEFQIWKLEVDLEKSRAVLLCQPDTDRDYVVRQRIGHTDFPLTEIKLYLERSSNLKVLLLPSER